MVVLLHGVFFPFHGLLFACSAGGLVTCCGVVFIDAQEYDPSVSLPFILEGFIPEFDVGVVRLQVFGPDETSTLTDSTMVRQSV